ncbi:MAG: ankyrin repeat domain-containing protein [Planctomycetota bacterium]
MANVEDSTPEVRLSEAIAAGDVRGIGQAIRSGADPNRPGRFGWVPLRLAAKFGNGRVLRALLKGGADPTLESTIRYCIYQDDTKLLKLLIEFGLDINAPSVRRWDGVLDPPLHFATRRHRVKCANLLVKSGAKADQPNDRGETPYYIARVLAHSSYLHDRLLPHTPEPEKSRVAKLYVSEWKSGVELDAQIQKAIALGQADRLKLLIWENDRDLTTWLRPNGYAILEWAISVYKALGGGRSITWGDTDYPAIASDGAILQIMQWLVDSGAPPDEGVYFPPLHDIAIMDQANPTIYELFCNMLAASTMPDTPTRMDQRTPLISAACRGTESVIRALLDRGADPNFKSRLGKTPLSMARGCEKTYHAGKMNPCIPLLIAAGAKE